jgi:hypothetical protein
LRRVIGRPIAALVVALAVVVAVAPLAVLARTSALVGPALAWAVPTALARTALTRTIPAALIRPALTRTTLVRAASIGATLVLIGTTLTLAGTATAAALVLVTAIPTAGATTVTAPAVIVATIATGRLRVRGLGRRRGLLGLRRLLRLTAPIGTAAAITAITARGLLLAPAAAVAPRPGLRLLLPRLRLLLAVVAATASAVETVLPRAGGLCRGPAQQRQDHGGRDQTFHFQVLQGALCWPRRSSLVGNVGLAP